MIDEKGLMTDELKNKIMECKKLVEVEDLYRPYKEKKKTKATDAINNGLEPLAKMIMSFPTNGDLESLTKKFINDKVKDMASAIEGAGYIIAEYISDNAYYRKWIRTYFYKNGIIVCKKKKDAEDEKKTYEMYYDYNESIKEVKPHRILAINRAEKEKVLSVNVSVNEQEIIDFLNSKIIKNQDSFVCEIVQNAIKDSYKRLISPSVEREVRSELSENAEISAIENFSKNLESLLMTPPMKGKMVLGLDPAFKNVNRKLEYIIVSEAGASVYSASKLAIEEFPDLHVEERSAVSIGRRLQDPLAELVKIDPESIGVGLY